MVHNSVELICLETICPHPTRGEVIQFTVREDNQDEGMEDNMFNKLLSILLMLSILIPQKTYEFTEEEVKSLYNSIQELENADSSNQKIIENLNEQIYMYIQQTNIDSTIIENYIEQLKLKEEFIKELKPKWYDNKYLWYTLGVASMIVPIWGIGQIK